MSWRTFVGALLILVGVGFVLDQVGLVDFGAVLSVWWPLILVAIGVLQLLTQSVPLPVGVAVTLVGGALLIDRLGLLPVNVWSLFWPLLILLAGVYLLLTRGGRGPAVSGADRLNLLALFGGSNHRIEAETFRGGSAVALFGGIDVDLTAARLDPEGAMLDLTAAFGGIEVVVPTQWRVKMSGLPLFGGWDNKTRTDDASGQAPVLTVRCLAAFGGIEVHN